MPLLLFPCPIFRLLQATRQSVLIYQQLCTYLIVEEQVQLGSCVMVHIQCVNARGFIFNARKDRNIVRQFWTSGRYRYYDTEESWSISTWACRYSAAILCVSIGESVDKAKKCKSEILARISIIQKFSVYENLCSLLLHIHLKDFEQHSNKPD